MLLSALGNETVGGWEDMGGEGGGEGVIGSSQEFQSGICTFNATVFSLTIARQCFYLKRLGLWSWSKGLGSIVKPASRWNLKCEALVVLYTISVNYSRPHPL